MEKKSRNLRMQIVEKSGGQEMEVEEKALGGGEGKHNTFFDIHPVTVI